MNPQDKFDQVFNMLLNGKIDQSQADAQLDGARRSIEASINLNYQNNLTKINASAENQRRSAKRTHLAPQVHAQIEAERQKNLQKAADTRDKELQKIDVYYNNSYVSYLQKSGAKKQEKNYDKTLKEYYKSYLPSKPETQPNMPPAWS